MALFVNKPGMRHIVPMAEESAEEGVSTPELWDNETMDFTMNNVKFAWDNESEAQLGSLFITSKRVIWVGESKAYDFDVPYITLHAVSKDPACYPQPCVFCQLDEDEDTEEENTEFFLIPEDEADVYRIFDAFSHAALLNPDPEDDEDDGGNDDFIFNADEVQAGAAQAMLAAWEGKFVEPGEEDLREEGEYEEEENGEGAMDEDDEENDDNMTDDNEVV
jgi:nucleotide-sensitive chloride channel 1A